MQRPFPDSPAKLRRFFFPAKFSGEKNFRTLNLPATPPVIARGASAPPPGLRPDTRRRPFRSRKRVQNYNFTPYPPNFPATFFRKNFIYSHHLTHTSTNQRIISADFFLHQIHCLCPMKIEVYNNSPSEIESTQIFTIFNHRSLFAGFDLCVRDVFNDFM